MEGASFLVLGCVIHYILNVVIFVNAPYGPLACNRNTSCFVLIKLYCSRRMNSHSIFYTNLTLKLMQNRLFTFMIKYLIV